MSQQLLIWGVSPFMIQQLEAEGVTAFEIFTNANETFNLEEYARDTDSQLSAAMQANAAAVLNEGMSAGKENTTIEIQGDHATLLHFLLTGEKEDSGLMGREPLDFILREEISNESSWLLANALVGSKNVEDAEDYVASYLNPEEASKLSKALIEIGAEDLGARCRALASVRRGTQVIVTDTEIHLEEGRGRHTQSINEFIVAAKDLIHSELIPLYVKASDRGHGILIAWSM